MNATVWAFKPLPELNGATGFVECEASLAAQLIASGEAQDPRDGGTAMNYITEGAMPKRHAPASASEYDTKVMTAKKPRKQKDD